MSTPLNNQGSTTSGLFGTTAGNSATAGAGTGTTSNPTSFFGNAGGSSSIFGNLPSSGGLFGKTTTLAASAPSTASASTPSIFGGATSNAQTSTNSFGKPATPPVGTPSSTAPGTTPSLFGGAATSAAPATTSASTTGSSFFGIPPAGASQTNMFGNLGGTPATTAPKSNLFVPLTSGTTASATTASNAAATPASSTKEVPSATTTTVSTGGLFGTVPQKSDGMEKKDAPPAAPTFNLFGTKDASSTMTANTTSTGGLFGTKPTTPATTAPLTASALAPKEGDKSKDATSSSAAIAVAPPSVLKGKTIEEIVNKWSSDLENQVREFNKFAAEVAVWDRALMENGNNLAALYSHVVAVEREQTEIEQTLDHIEQQQRDLSSTLDAYERSAEEILGAQGGSLRALDTGPADTERDKKYVNFPLRSRFGVTMF
ncbi:hypothetical protein ID866_2745 [Astraeus odoratus]|nr:hypothetical protein ID866_2745 [Astraeus odoratus]